MKHDKNKFEWISSAGGPLILLEQTYFSCWKGVNSDSEPTDYDRACTIDEYIGLISISDGNAIVLGDMPMSTAWYPIPNRPEGIIVRWGYANNEVSIVKAISIIPKNVWLNTGLFFQVRHPSLSLFDSACDSEDIEESLSIKLGEGNYSIDTAEYKPDEETWLVLHRLRLTEGALGKPLTNAV